MPRKARIVVSFFLSKAATGYNMAKTTISKQSFLKSFSHLPALLLIYLSFLFPLTTFADASVCTHSRTGSASGPGPAPKQIDGVICFPDPVRKACHFDECRGVNKETFHDTSQKVKSSVNTVLREYNLDNKDISIKASNSTISIKRWFYNNQWHWEHDRNNLNEFRDVRK
jgi:hypothetical protein